MPLFKSRPDVHEVDNNRRTPSTTSPTRKGSIFSARRGRSLSPTSSNTSPSYNSTTSTRHNGSTRRGFFQRRSSSVSSDSSARRNRNDVHTGKGGFFGMGNGNANTDPSILAARQKVTDAEEAEREADRALEQARGMVREARQHVKILEQEALEDARRAKAKHAEAKIVSKSARGLGRHGV